jgi:thiamine biosynthesis lipoprotein
MKRCCPLLGTFVEVTAPDGHAEAVERAFDAIASVHAAMSFHEPTSDLARLRSAEPGTPVKVDPQTVAVLQCAQDLYAETAGLFDVAVGGTLVASGFLPSDGIADPSAFDGTTADIELLGDNRVCCHRPTLVDLGGIAKGHAVDLAVEELRACGVAEGLVNAGGDLRAFGDREWPVGLRDADGEVRLAVQLRDYALASSANLRQRRRANGAEHSPHIGRSGRAILADRRVSVVAPNCILADALTKVALADRELAAALLAERGGQLLEEDVS